MKLRKLNRNNAKKEKPKTPLMKCLAPGVLLAALALTPTNSKADEKQSSQETADAKPGLSVAVAAGGYDTVSEPILGAEIAVNYPVASWLTVDTKTSILSRVADSNSVELDEAELDLTFPISGPVTATVIGYRSQYYAVLYGAGVAFHLELPKSFALHLVPQVNDGPLVPVPLNATADTKYVSIALGAVPIVNHSMLDKPAPLIGVDASIAVHVKSVDIFVKVFEMTTMDSDKKLEVGVLNLNGGLRFNF